MDGMALLCNLHADGPETLRSLREEGCATLQQLHELEPERLSALIGFTPAAARRFLREGRMLLERLGDAGLEGQPTHDAPTATPALGASERPLHDRSEAGHLPVNEQAILARVLERWHEVDPLSAADEAVVQAPSPAPTSLPKGLPEPADDSTPLHPGLVEALDESLCEALAAHGIRTLTQLAERSPEQLAQATGLPFTRARRLQFLARRGADSDVLPALVPTPRQQVQSGEKISLAFPDLPPAPPPVAPPVEAATAPERESRPAAVPARESGSAGKERETPGGPFA